MKNPAASSAILALMFASLLVIYVVVPQNDLVTFLSVVIMGIGLVIAFIGESEEIMMMAGLAGIVSLIAAYFAGQSAFGNAGGVIAAVLWCVGLFVMARRASAETVVIPEDHAFMVAPFLSSQARSVATSLTFTNIPFLDRHVATIPTYELVRDVKVENVNLFANHNIDQLMVHARYRVQSPSETLRGIPNRGRIQIDIAREMGVSVSKARLDVAFWEKLLAHQMNEEVDDIVRQVFFRESVEVARVQPGSGKPAEGAERVAIQEGDDNPDYKWGLIRPLPEGLSLNVELAYKNRILISEKVRKALQILVERWGVEVIDVVIDSYKADPNIIKGLKGSAPFEGELERERLKRERTAKDEAFHIRQTGVARAETIRDLIDKVKAAHPELKSQDVTEIVKAALIAGAWEEDDLEVLIGTQQGGKK